MGDIVKLAVRLFVFALVAAVALALTNEVTKGPIAEQAMAAQKEALNKVLPGSEYAEIAYEGLAEGSLLDQIFVGTNAAGEIDGYALTASPNGYGGPIPITLGVSTEGYVTQVYVGALSETAGLGSRVGEDEFMDRFIAIAADPDTLREDVSTLSGATISSTAFLNAVSEMLTYTRDTLGITPASGDRDAVLAAYKAANGGDEAAEPVVTTGTYNVTGFADFTVEIAVDDAGKIVSVIVLEHNETPGFGADLIADTAVFDALVGQDIVTAQIDIRAGATLTSTAINDALSQAANGGSEGGAAVYDVTGFAPFKVAIEVDGDGKIVSVSVPEHGETPGFGADLIADTAVFDALVGQDIATAQIEIKSGATLTSTAINDALSQAAAANGGEAAAPAVPGDPYTVKGMNKFTLYIEVTDGVITAISAPEHNETPGLGADLLTEEALAALVGQSLAETKVDTVSGVTLTSEAIGNALRQAAMANGIAIAEPETEEVEAEPVEEPEAEAEPETEPAQAEGPEATMVEVAGIAPFTMAIAVDEDGKIVSVSAEHNETPGLGADMLTEEALAELVGQDIASAQIDVKSGVTLTSEAINSALRQAAEANGFAAAEPETEEPEVETEEPEVETEEPEVETEKPETETEEPETETEEPVTEPEPEAETEVEAPEQSDGPEPRSVEVTGFQPLTLAVTTDNLGKILSVEVTEHNETPGFGADLIADTAVFEALIGQYIGTAQIDVRAGATLTSNAINEALQKIAEITPVNLPLTQEMTQELGPVATVDGSVAAPVATADEATESEAEPADEEPAEEIVPVAYEVTGFAPFTVEIAVDADGKIVSVVVPEHNETPGLGATLIEEDGVLEALVGQDIAGAQIDVKANVTLTSTAINDALAQAAAAYAAGQVQTFAYEVTGFAPFTVEIMVGADGKIVSVIVTEHSETPGLGATLIEEDGVLEALAGQDIASAQIDVKANVTLTSSAINDALAQAAKEVQ